MTLLAKIMAWLSVAAWCVAVGAFAYANRYWLPMWVSGLRGRGEPKGYRRRAMIGIGVFVAAIGMMIIAGGIAQFWPGGWHN